MKTPSQRSFQISETNSYQNSSPGTILEENDNNDEDFEDIANNCIVATDFNEVKGKYYYFYYYY